MSAPNKVSAPGAIPPPSGTDALDLRIETLLVDPSNKDDPQQYVKKWKDTGYHVQHRKMDYAIEMVQRYVSGDAKVDEAKATQALKDWKESDEFKNDPADKVVLGNLLSEMAKVKGTPQGKAVLGALPGGEQVLNPPAPPAKKEEGTDGYDMKRYYNFGVSFRQDTGLLKLFDVVGIPLSAFAADQHHINGRLSLDFPMGDHVGMVRLGAGTSVLKGVPGEAIDPTQKTDPGLSWRVNADFGLVDPSSKSHMTSGLGFEVIGIAKHAGQDQGISAPAPLVRLHFFKQSEIPINIGSNFQLGIGSFFNQQETFFPLGSGEPLLAGPNNTPVSVTSSLFARNSIPWLVLSGRYYWNGLPDYGAFDPNGPMAPGEASAKVVSLIPSKFIMYNRARDASAFATNQVFMALEPLGAKGSRDQFDTLSIGLWAYSVLDGIAIAGNADARADIYLRAPSWWHKGSTIALDGGFFLWHVIGAATRAGDPPYGNIPEFQKNPGSVTDFDGRANNMLWKMDLWEGALTAGTYGLEKATSRKGYALNGDAEHDNAIKKDQWIYRGVGIGSSVVGLAGVLLAGGISGQGCGSEGSLLACTFPGTREKFFAPGQDFSPATMTGIENHYVVSSIFSSMLAWGVPKIFYSAPDPRPARPEGAPPEAPKASVTGRLEVTPSKVYVGLQGTF